MKNAGAAAITIILGAAGSAHADPSKPAKPAAAAAAPAPAAKAKAKPEAKAMKTPSVAKAAQAAKPEVSDHCAIDDLGFDQMLAKRDAQAPAPPAKKAAPAVDTIAQSRAAADKFELGRKSRDANRPTADESRARAKTLSVGVVGAVVAQKMSELEYCLLQIPEEQRGSEQFTLHLAISPKGAVTTAALNGADNAASIEACVKTQVQRWTFPVAEAATELDYPLAFKVQHIEN
jgi:hypothetical protein